MKEKTGPSNQDGGVEKRGQRRFNGQFSKEKIEKRNMQRLGGRGLSLQAFANAKSRTKNDYNPAFISAMGYWDMRTYELAPRFSCWPQEQQREFYKNAKFVKKYKRSLRQQETQDEVPMATRHSERRNDTGEATPVNQNKRGKKSKARSLGELYEKKREEEEKAKMEREASIQAKKDERQRAEARRKSSKEKMFKKTKSGQPVMKYRIEHILETIQGSSR